MTQNATPQRDERYTFDRVVRLLLSVGTLACVIWLLQYLSAVLIPFTVALLIAYLLNPVVNLFESRCKSRPVAVLITLFGCVVFMFLGILLLVPIAGGQINDFQRMLSELRQETHEEAPANAGAPVPLGQRFDDFIGGQSNEWAKWGLVQVRDFVRSEDFEPGSFLLQIGRKIAPGVWGVVTGAMSLILGLTGFVLIILYVVFLLNDFRLVERTWKEHLPPRYREPMVEFLYDFREAMSRYFRGQFVIAACMAVLFAIGFQIIGLRMGILLGLFVGMLNMVPYLQVAGLVPAAALGILRAVEGHSGIATSLLLVAAVFAVAQLIQDAVLMPRIMGKATGLRPAIILLGVCVWGQLLGFLGLVLAIPLTCLGLAYYRRVVLVRSNS